MLGEAARPIDTRIPSRSSARASRSAIALDVLGARVRQQQRQLVSAEAARGVRRARMAAA